MFSLSGVNSSYTLLKSQLLSAKCKTTNENNMLRSREEIVNNTTLDMLKTCDRNHYMGALSLIQYALTMQFTEGSKNEAASVLNESC